MTAPATAAITFFFSNHAITIAVIVGDGFSGRKLAKIPMEKPVAIWSGVALRCDSLCRISRSRYFRAILAIAQSAWPACATSLAI